MFEKVENQARIFDQSSQNDPQLNDDFVAQLQDITSDGFVPMNSLIEGMSALIADSALKLRNCVCASDIGQGIFDAAWPSLLLHIPPSSDSVQDDNDGALRIADLRNMVGYYNARTASDASATKFTTKSTTLGSSGIKC